MTILLHLNTNKKKQIQKRQAINLHNFPDENPGGKRKAKLVNDMEVYHTQGIGLIKGT